MLGIKAMVPQQFALKETEMNRTLKLAATSLVVLLGTTAGAFAATYGWIDEDTKVKEHHSKWSDTLAWAQEGEKVKVLDHENGYYYVQRKGKDGWVDDDDVDFHYDDDHHADVEFCIGGGGFGGGGFGYGEFCVGN
jgi:uncharacterized protein YgiM (DUF1202 family)